MIDSNISWREIQQKNLGRTTMLKEKKRERERERERLEEKKRMKSGTYMMLIGF